MTLKTLASTYLFNYFLVPSPLPFSAEATEATRVFFQFLAHANAAFCFRTVVLVCMEGSDPRSSQGWLLFIIHISVQISSSLTLSDHSIERNSNSTPSLRHFLLYYFRSTFHYLNYLFIGYAFIISLSPKWNINILKVGP